MIGSELSMGLARVEAQMAESMERQPNQFAVHCRATELWEDGLPQREPRGVQIQQPVLLQPIQQGAVSDGKAFA